MQVSVDIALYRSAWPKPLKEDQQGSPFEDNSLLIQYSGRRQDAATSRRANVATCCERSLKVSGA